MEHVQYLLLGLGNGAVYAALAVALVVTFRSSGVVNFAAGALALYAAYTYAFLRQGELLNPIPGTPATLDVGGPLGLAPAMAASLLISAVLSLLLYLGVFRPLRHAPPVASVVASVGLTVVLQALLAQRVGTRPLAVAAIFPDDPLAIGTGSVQADRFWFAGVIVVVAVAVGALYRYTSFGLMTRAAAATEKGAVLTGLAPDRLAALNWMLAGIVTGLSGILIAPIVPLVPVSYTLFVVPALAAAVLGQFRLLGLTVTGALGVGMLQSEATFLAVRYDWLPDWIVPRSGLPELIPLAVVLVVLVARARPLISRGVVLTQVLGGAPRPERMAGPALVGATVATAAILGFGSEWRLALITSMIYAVIALSLVVVTGYGGQISLAQLSLAGVGGYMTSTLSDTWGVPFPLAPLLAALVATVVGVVIGLPALRLRGLHLGIVTLALAATLEALWFRNNDFNGGVDGARVAPPDVGGLDLGIGAGLAFPREEFALVCLAVLVTSALAVAGLRRSRLGAWVMAVRVNERAAAAAGVPVVRVKLVVFAVGAFLAGLGGSLTAYRQGIVTFDLYTTLAGVSLFAIVYLAGVTSIAGALVAGLLASGGLAFRTFDQVLDLGEWYQVVTGALLVGSVVLAPEGVVGPLHRILAGRRRVRAPAPERSPTRPWSRPGDGSVLTARELTVRYGNVVAVDRLGLSVGRGEIVGLIGPNGAGKTSVLDALTGFAPCQGAVTGPRGAVDDLAPHRRARQGMMRTFQAAQLCDELTVLENVSIGLAAGGAVSDVRHALDLLDLTPLAVVAVAELSQGQRQLVAVARALAGRPDVILLDEPAGGLDSAESTRLGHRLRSIAQIGVGVLLVDHDMSLVLEVCDRLVVVDFGRLIAEGTPAEVRADPAVNAAYLGHTGAAV